MYYLIPILLVGFLVLRLRPIYRLERYMLFKPHKLTTCYKFNLKQNMLEYTYNKINIIYYKHHQSNTKNVILYIHGNGGSLQSRIPIISLLGNYSSLVAFDPRGYGKSDTDSSNTNFSLSEES